jgi:hypothetical protein
MSYVDWRLKGRETGNCNCAYGCPCQFNALPTHGDCRAVNGLLIDEGHFGDTPLDGLCVVYIADWPGPIHEGDGTFQAIIDERADAAQRDALSTIVHGGEAAPGSSEWAIFATTVTKVHEPLYRPIDMAIDVEARIGHIRVDGLVDCTIQPIRNPVTGAEHRARIDLPNGFQFRLAECASGSSRVTGAIPMQLDDSFAVFSHIHHTAHGRQD